MIRRYIRRIDPSAWLLIGLVAGWSIVWHILQVAGAIPYSGLLYIIHPVVALLLAFGASRLLRGKHDRVRHKAQTFHVVLAIMAFWLILYFLSGLVTSYVRNPLVSSVFSIVQNMWAYGLVAVAYEYIRYSIAVTVGRRNLWFGVVIVLVFTFAQLTLTQFFSPSITGVRIVELVVSHVIPVLASNIVLTYLVFVAGLGSAIVYRLALVVGAILLPIIPRYDWYLEGIAGLLLAAAVFVAVDYTRRDLRRSRRPRHHSPSIYYQALSITLLGVFAVFMAGIFTYKPVAIMSNSMQPVYSRGDIVIVQKLGETMDIHVGDIVQYTKRNRIITHRVVDIYVGNETTGQAYITKGDSNRSNDAEMVQRAEVNGIVHGRIPVIGYPTIWLNERVFGYQSEAPEL